MGPNKIVPIIPRVDCIFDKSTGKGPVYKAWEAVNGPIPRPLQILHHCDNGFCKNVKHMFLGTQKENLQDASRKGRLKFDRPWTHHQNHFHFGEANPNAKLTQAQADEIRQLHASDTATASRRKITRKTLAKQFNVSERCIKHVLEHSNW